MKRETEKKAKILCDLGVGGERGRVFSVDGIIGALSATDWKDAEKILVLDDGKEDKGIRLVETE